MNDCPNADLRDRLPDLVHGSLDAATEARLLAHLAQCADCSAELALLRTSHRVLRAGSPSVDVSRIAAAVAARRGASQPQLTRVPDARRLPRRWQRASAGALLAAGLATFWFAATRDGDRLDPRSRADASAVAAGESASGGTAERAVAAAGMSLGGGFEGLSDDDLNVLLQDLDRVDVFSDVDLEDDLGTMGTEDAT